MLSLRALFGRALQSFFPVRFGERRLALLLFGHGFLAVGAFVTGRSVRDALFLEHSSLTSLAWMYVASALAVALLGLAYHPIAGVARRDRLATISASLFAALFVLAWWLERTHAPWIYPLLYVYVEAMGAMTIVQFWTLANDLFNAREAKRLYGLVGAGGTVANIVIGFVTARMATRFGASALLLLSAALLALCAVAAFLAARIGRQRLFARAASGRAGTSSRRPLGAAGRVLTSGHLRTVAVLTGVTYFTTTLVDFQFKVVAGSHHHGDQLAAFFGYFYSVAGVVALGLALFGTGRILSRFGVIGSLALLPASLGIGSGLFAAWPTLWAVTGLKGADVLFRYSVNDATTQILYLPVAPNARASAKAFIDGVVKSAAIAAGGGVLLLAQAGSFSDPSRLAWVGLVACAVWAVLIGVLRPRYIRSLQDTLRTRRLDLDSVRHSIQDGSTGRVLSRALQSDNPREVLNALELLPHLDRVSVDGTVAQLLAHTLPSIRIAALHYLGNRRVVRVANAVFQRFDDPDSKVRAAAVEAFCAIGRDRAVKSVRGFVEDPDPSVRSAAVIGMIRYGGLDGVLAAAEALKGLIQHADPVMREHAAQVLGAIGVQNFYQPVLELMSDPELAVRRAAIRAAGVLKSPEFVIPLIYKTQRADTLLNAIEALAAYGSSIAPTLDKVLGNRLEAAQIRRGVARVLGRLASPEALQVITRHLQEADETLRTLLYRSLSRAVRGNRGLPLDRLEVESALEREILRVGRALSAAEALGLGAGPTPYTPREGPDAARALLASALADKAVQAEHRLFLLLAVLYPEAGMERIYAGILHADVEDARRRRANAVELFDNLLDRDLRLRLLPLLEDTPRAVKLATLRSRVDLPAPNPQQALRELLGDESGWVRACALYFCSQGPAPLTEEEILAASRDTNPAVRELSLVACVDSAPARAAQLAEWHLRDDEPVVRQRAALIATHPPSAR